MFNWTLCFIRRAAKKASYICNSNTINFLRGCLVPSKCAGFSYIKKYLKFLQYSEVITTFWVLFRDSQSIYLCNPCLILLVVYSRMCYFRQNPNLLNHHINAPRKTNKHSTKTTQCKQKTFWSRTNYVLKIKKNSSSISDDVYFKYEYTVVPTYCM